MSDTIKRALKKISRPNGYNEPVIRGIVQSIDKDTFTCNVQAVANSLVMTGVKLKPVINGGGGTTMGLVVFPAVGSFVLVGQVAENNVDLFVISCTQIDSIALNTGSNIGLNLQITSDGKISLNSSQITFNGGNNGGIPEVQPLTDAINNLQDQINQLVLAFNSHIHSPGAPPTPTPPLIPATQGAHIDRSTIENTSIVQ